MSTSILSYEVTLDGQGDSSNILYDLGTATPFGGGVFLTAAHVFYQRHIHVDGDLTDPHTDTYYVYSGKIAAGTAAIDKPVPMSSQYDPTVSSPTESPDVTNHDITYFTAPGAANLTPASPVVVFADRSAASGFFKSGLDIDVDGANVHTTGIVSGLASGDGQFLSTYSAATKPGDSGGAISTELDGTNYVVGIHNAEYKDTTVALDTYISKGLYVSAASHISAGDPTVKDLPPALFMEPNRARQSGLQTVEPILL